MGCIPHIDGQHGEFAPDLIAFVEGCLVFGDSADDFLAENEGDLVTARAVRDFKRLGAENKLFTARAGETIELPMTLAHLVAVQNNDAVEAL